MKIFIDTANLDDIAEALKKGFADGITTNPKLLSKEPKAKFEEHIRQIIALIREYDYSEQIPLSVEVFSWDPKEIVAQALRFVEEFEYPGLVIKVQIGWNELEAIYELSRLGIAVNCTAIMSITQAIMAAKAGARYVSLFWGRIRDGGEQEEFYEQRVNLSASGVLDKRDYDPSFAVRNVRQLLDRSNLQTEIIVGSVRQVVDIRDAFLSGAHIVTIPPKFFESMCSHFKTDETVNEFFTAFAEWTS